jgi:PAS domain S-box-containing protein
MIRKNINRLKSINPWHFLWIGVVCSEVLGVLLNTIQSYIWWGFLSRDLLLIGIIDGLFVPLLVAPIVIYFVFHAERLEELNRELQLEIAKAKQSEEEILRKSEARYRSIVEDQTEFINRFLPDGTVTFVNEACCLYLGIKREEVLGRSYFPMLSEADRERLQSLLSSLNAENPLGAIQHKLIKRDGTAVWQQWTNRAIFDEKGGLIEFQAVGRDITKLKLAEQALAESEELYRVLFENAPVGIGIADANGDLITFNDAMLSPGGYSIEDIAHIKNVSALYYDIEERGKILDITRKQRSLHQYPVQFRRKDGTPYDTLLSLGIVTYKGKACIQAMVEDITERKKTEDILRKSEKRYRQLFDDCPFPLLEIDLSQIRSYLASIESQEAVGFRRFFENNREAVKQCAGLLDLVNINSAAMGLFGAATKQELAENLVKTFCDESYDFFREDVIAFAEGKESREHEYPALTLTGKRLDLFLKWFFTAGSGENASSAIVALVDLSQLKGMERALLRTEDLFRKLVETMNEGLGMQDGNGIVTYVNEKLCSMMGYSYEEMEGKHLYNFMDESAISVLEEQMEKRKKGEKTPYEIKWTRKDGRRVDMLVAPQPLFDESGAYKGSFAVFTDITTRKLDEELIHAYKDRLSRLTSRLSLVEEKERRKVASELHDNIGQILAYAHMMLIDLQKSARGGTGGSLPENSLEEIRSLIEQSIKYTRSLTFELSTPLLYEIGLEPAVEWLGQEFQKKHGIEFRMEDDGTDKPLGDETRILLFQSIRELLTNVVKHARARTVAVSLRREDVSIVTSVEDDGIGIDVGSIYDGSYIKRGFGLFSIRERLKNIGGTLDIESKPGSSTRVILRAPLENGRKTGEKT